jgi:hypothetical protein
MGHEAGATKQNSQTTVVCPLYRSGREVKAHSISIGNAMNALKFGKRNPKFTVARDNNCLVELIRHVIS